MRSTAAGLLAFATGVIAITVVAVSPTARAASASWNARGAAAYLDSRQEWWQHWPNAARDHDTACVSCHTALPYALARPALQKWSFSREGASRITQPVLAVVGAISQRLDPIWNERLELLLSWLPRVEAFVLPDATHLMQAQNPRGMAERMAAFFIRHPLAMPA